MGVTNTQPIAPTPRKRKSLFPFKGLMRSVEFEGKGACLAENVVLDDGRLRKMKAPSLVMTRAGIEGYRWMSEEGFEIAGVYYDLYLIDSGLSGKYILEMYNLTTGVTTYPQMAEADEVAITGTFTFTNASTAVSATSGAFSTELAVGDYIYSDGEYSDGVRIASITDDDNLVLESAYGGAGASAVGKLATKHFTTTELHFRQLGDEGYLATYEASNNGMSFDGTTLTVIANFPTLARYLLLDGNRLACNELASGAISATMTDFNAGAGVLAKKTYSTSLKANGGIETSSGIILMADLGGDLQKVIPNAASNDVSAETKLDSFNYTGQGIQNSRQIIMGKDFAYIINTLGIIEINPYTGESKILTDQGNIGRRWKDYDVSTSVLRYDSKNNRIVALVKDVGQYDTMIVVDLDEGRAVSVQPNSYVECIANINNQLYGGSSQDGKLLKLFNSYSDRDGNKLALRWVGEWDALEGIGTENILKQILIHANLNSKSEMIVKLYKNGSHEPIKTETFAGSSSQETQGASIFGVMGKYLFGLGGSRTTVAQEATDLIRKVKKSTRIVSYTLEIYESSVYNFSVYDVIVEYKSRNRLSREKVQPNALF